MNKNTITLTDAIYRASKEAFSSLFKNNEHYYFCSLVTTEDGMVPAISGWSYESFDKAAIMVKDKTHLINIKWSSEDSPYYYYGNQYFGEVSSIILKRPSIDKLDEDEWNTEMMMRLTAMELAMKKNDNDGLFSINQSRDKIVIAVELSPPQDINIEITCRLNEPSSALSEYLSVNS